MKKEVSKKSMKWLWIAIAIVAVAAIAVTAIFVLPGLGSGKDSEKKATDRADLYWNVDRKFYTESSESGLSTREPGADGVFTVRFAYEGELVELPVADKRLVNFIDTMDCMGIVKDDAGTVIDVYDPKTVATEMARMFYVRKAENGVLTLNSSMAMNGMALDVPIIEGKTEIYDVTTATDKPGQIISLEQIESMDAVTIYANSNNEATHIYVVTHPVESPVYWRADQFYSSTNKKTTRVPDAEGYYTIPFYCEGELVELKCKEEGIVNTIDAKNRFKAHTGLVVEDGVIVDNMLSATGIRGLLGCEMYEVTEVNGSTFTAEAQISNNGDVYTSTLSADAVIYNVSLAAKPEVRGKAVDSLQVGDRIVVFENTEGEAIQVFVAHRLVDSPMYFNMTKKYNSTSKETTRVPDGNGWYTIEMFSEGVTKTYKTKDKALMSYIDSQNNRGVGLEISGDEIVYAWPGECVAGYSALVGYSVQNVTGSIISMTPSTDPNNVTNRILNGAAKVYNMSGVKQKKGEETTLQVGDYCIFWRNAKSEIVYAYVIRRQVDAPIYFSMTRKWDSTTQQSTRTPVDGWYIYECATEGKQVTVKTQSKAAADFLDSQSPQTFALKVGSDGVIYEYYETANVTGGAKAYLNTYVRGISGKELTLYNPTNGKTYTPKMAEGCKIFNVSSVYERLRGEKSSLQIGDRIQCYTNLQGEVVLIYIRLREVDADIYFSKHRIKTTTEDGKTTRQPDAEGYYVFECAHEGEEVTVKTKSLDVATLMDAQSPQAFALKVDKNGIIQKAYPATAATGGSTRALNAIVKSVDGNKVVVRLTNGEDFEMPMASSYKVFNVSEVYEDHWGEKTTIQVGDSLQSYTDKDNKICLVYVRTRPDDVKLYWNIDKQYDSEGKISKRTRQADGYFHVMLSVDGEIKEFLVQEQSVINYIDSANGAVACTIKGGIITKAQSAIYGNGIWSSTEAAVIATVKEVKDGALLITDSNGKERELKLNAECKIFDVSSTANPKGKKAEPKVGDYGRIYLNMDYEVMYFYIQSHGSAPVPESKDPITLYWNLNRNTDPTPDADGWYHFQMAVGGEIKSFKTKDETAANYADNANGAVALTLSADDPTVFVRAQSALYATGVDATGANGAVSAVTETYAIVGANNNILLLADGVEIYDISGTGEFVGVATQLEVGDNIARAYVDEGGYALYIYIDKKAGAEPVVEPLKIYWNVDRQKDDNGSTRTPDADGWYYIDMAVDGEIKTFKTKNKKIIDYLDKGNGGATALTLDGDVIVAATSALDSEGVEAAGKGGTVKAIDGNTVTIISSGTDYVVTMAADCKVYDAVTGSATIGQYTELKVGDNFRCYNNADGEMLHIYVLSRAAEEPTPEEPEVPTYDNSNLAFAEGTTDAMCTYCGKVVTWTALEQINAAFDLEDGGHYYLASDVTGNDSYYNVATGKAACVHLNGHNVTANSRVFAVASDGHLNIMGNGIVTGSNTSTATANVAAATLSCRGSMNLIGGTYKHTASTLPTIIMSRPQKTVNIYEGVTIEGTEGVTGTNFYLMFGVVNMYGGTITGGTATPNGTTDGKGDNLYVYGWTGSTGARAEFNLLGGTIDGGIYAEKHTETYLFTVSGDAVITANKGGLTLDSETGAKLTVGELTDGAEIYVTGTGAITNEFANAAAYVNTKILPASANITLTAEGNVIVATVEAPAEPEPEPVWVMAWVVDPQFDEATTSTTRTPDADGYYFVELSVDGVTQTYKTKATGLMGEGDGIDYVDQSGFKNRAVSICLTEEGSLEFTKALGATNNTGATGAKVTTITAIEDGVITGTGVDYEGKIAEGGKVFDVSPNATVEGEITDLRVGDYCRFYTDAEGNVLYGYVYTRAAVVEPEPEPEPVEVDMNTVCEKADAMASVLTGGNVEAECPACGKTVTWQPMPTISGSTKLVSGHYYFESDVIVDAGYYSVNAQTEAVDVCIHLNGKTYQNTGTGNTRLFYADYGAKLTIMGSGNLIGARGTTTAAERCGSTLEVVGKGTVVNVCGGTWSKTNDALDVIGFRGREGSVGIYNGTVINIGDVQGNALWVAGGNVNLAGGEINGNVLVRKYNADTASLQYDINLTLSGTTINGVVTINTEKGAEISTTLMGTPVIAELVVDSTLPLNIGRLTAGADVKITAEGAINNANPNLQDYVDAGFLSAKEEGKIITVTEGVGTIAAAQEAKYDNSNLVFEEGTTKALCTWCGEVKEWTALASTADGSNDSLADGGHYYLPADYLDNVGRYTVGDNTTVCVHLNGHDVTNVSNRVFTISTKASTLTIMGNGTVIGNFNTTTTENVAAATISVRRNLNLVGGTYLSGENSTLPAILMASATGQMNMYEDVTIGGNGLTIAYGYLTMEGGVISNLDVLGYDLKPTHAQASATILGGTIENARLDARDPEGAYKTYRLDMILSGAAKVGNVELLNGAKLTLDGLKSGAEIFVNAPDGAITVENAKAADYLALGYIKSGVTGKTITEAGGILSIG